MHTNGTRKRRVPAKNGQRIYSLFFVMVDYETGEMSSYTSATPSPATLSRRCRRSVLRHRKNAAKVTSG